MKDRDAMDGRYYAENGKVWKAPVATKTETGQSISIGFPVCTMHDAAGKEAAVTVAALMNLGAAARQWQPIETAPKDGTHVLAAVRGLTRIVSWGKTSHVPLYGFCLADQGAEDSDLCEPTHWMPLPEPPK